MDSILVVQQCSKARRACCVDVGSSPVMQQCSKWILSSCCNNVARCEGAKGHIYCEPSLNSLASCGYIVLYKCACAPCHKKGGDSTMHSRVCTLSLAHCMVCSIVAGKDLRVQYGTSLSGGSCCERTQKTDRSSCNMY